MRILHVGWGMRPFRYGGLITYAEDLMQTQAAAGHDVAYFFSGRHYPVVSGPRLKQWRRDGVEMFEIVNTTLAQGGDRGTLAPLQDLRHPASEAAFGAVLRRFRPDVVHIQELLALPSAIIDVAHGEGVPVVMTAHDYFALCPTIKLYDVDDLICMRDRVGEQCARCCRDAPSFPDASIGATAIHDLGRLADRLPLVRRLPRPKPVAEFVGAVAARAARRAPDGTEPDDGGGREVSPAPPEEYQERRDRNVEQLNKLDALITQSHRLGEIYGRHGMDSARITTIHSAPRYLTALAHRPPAPLEDRVQFATINGCASVQKGSAVVLAALRRLHERGLGDRFTLSVFGYVAPDTARALDEFGSVRRCGIYGEDEIEQRFAHVHVGIVPSVWEEAYGYVGPEFLAQGIPVIGNGIGGIVDYTRDGETGWVNRDCTGEGLAAIMERIALDPAQITDLNRSIERVREQILIPMERHAEMVGAVYRGVVGAR